jgi:hypothetical protein
VKILIWNIRGMGQKARVRQLRELLQQEQVEIVGLHETIKKHFSNSDLMEIGTAACSLGNEFLHRGIQEVSF